MYARRRPSMFWMNVAAVVAAGSVLALVLIAIQAVCPRLACLGVTISPPVAMPTPAAMDGQLPGGAVVVPQPVAPPQVAEPTAVLGGVPGSGDPNVGGGVPSFDGNGGVIIDLSVQPAAVEPTAVPAFTTSAGDCKAQLWRNELPNSDCFGRWRQEGEDGAITELDVYLATAPAQCQQLPDAQEGGCLTAVQVATGYIVNYMENQQ